jgi:WD40 repeat protein
LIGRDDVKTSRASARITATGIATTTLALLALNAPAIGQETTRMSVDSNGVGGDNNSYTGFVSADGGTVVLYSDARNLVSGDTNGYTDAFVHDRVTGVTERVSVSSSGTQGNSWSWGESSSSDGQIVAFTSTATNFVGGLNAMYNVYVRDRSTGVTELDSVDSSGVAGDGDSGGGSLSADGNVVAFESQATNLVANDTNGYYDVFIHIRSTGVTKLMSAASSGTQGNNTSFGASISADGKVVAFHSDASNLVAGDTNNKQDVFVHDRNTGITERVSVDSSGKQGNGASYTASISSDGNVVVFESDATNLVSGDTNGFKDVFVHDRTTGITERVSVGPGGVEGNHDSMWARLSSDGQVVAFTSDASNLVQDDTIGTDVFIRDRTRGITVRMSVDSSGAQGDGRSYGTGISDDGQVIAFSSDATNLVAGDHNNHADAFVHERCPTSATWSNYGTGFPGTNGIPSFTSRVNPAYGATVTLDLANSSNQLTVALLMIGFQKALVPTGKGGDLLVVPSLNYLVPLTLNGSSFSGYLPPDEAICGVELFAQAIEIDPGAAKGLSFTAGLDLLLGQ